MEPTLVCDFDGTLLNCDSQHAFTRYLRKHHRIGIAGYALTALFLPLNTILTHLDRPRRVRAWGAFRPEAWRRTQVTDFLQNGAEDLALRPEVLEIVRTFSGRRLLLTGSDEGLVRGLLEKFGIADLFENVLGAETGRCGVFLTRHPYGVGKLPLLPPEPTLGIGDGDADRHFLSRCESACIVPRGKKLLALAKDRGWRIL